MVWRLITSVLFGVIVVRKQHGGLTKSADVVGSDWGVILPLKQFAARVKSVSRAVTRNSASTIIAL